MRGIDIWWCSEEDPRHDRCDWDWQQQRQEKVRWTDHEAWRVIMTRIGNCYRKLWRVTEENSPTTFRVKQESRGQAAFHRKAEKKGGLSTTSREHPFTIDQTAWQLNLWIIVSQRLADQRAWPSLKGHIDGDPMSQRPSGQYGTRTLSVGYHERGPGPG